VYSTAILIILVQFGVMFSELVRGLMLAHNGRRVLLESLPFLKTSKKNWVISNSIMFSHDASYSLQVK
jgi:hypothetical protein